jgi:hypothetical protein
MAKRFSLMQTELKIPSRESKHQLMKLESGIFFSEASGGIYETTKREVEPDAFNHVTTSSPKPWARWGKDNNYPQRLIDAVMTDPAAALMEKRRAFHWGSGLMFFKKRLEKDRVIVEPVLEEQVSPEIQDFFYMNDMPNFVQGCIADFEWWHSFPVQYISDGTGKITRVKWHRMKDVRSELRDKKTGEIKNFYLSGMWPEPQENEYAIVPAFDKFGNGSGLYRHQLVSIDKDYNPQPAWHSITRWLYIASKIPRWILANIDNSMNIKYHVQIPIEYFHKRHPIEAYKTSEERNKAIEQDIEGTYDRMDKYLAGEKNVHKAFYSFVAVNEQGNEIPGWKIIPLENKIQDEAWLHAYGTASMAIISGIGLSPSIAGSILPNGLGSGSGSDLREQFNFYMQVMTAQPRQTTLEPWEIIKRRNNWAKDLHLGYRDVILQTTDQNKSGVAKAAESDPTTDKQDTNKTQP